MKIKIVRIDSERLKFTMNGAQFEVEKKQIVQGASVSARCISDSPIYAGGTYKLMAHVLKELREQLKKGS